MDYIDDALVEESWRDLDGQISRQQIAAAVTEEEMVDRSLMWFDGGKRP